MAEETKIETQGNEVKEEVKEKKAKKAKVAKNKTTKATEKVANKETKKESTKTTTEKVAKKENTKTTKSTKTPAKKVKKESAEKVATVQANAVKEKKTKQEIYDVLEVEGYHHLKLYTYVYDKIKNPKAVVLIIHGMMEHAGRYYDFAKFLNDNGYIVVANDLRGHGHSAIDKKYGVGEKDIYAETVQDEIIILEKLKDAYELPIYLFGHSYGSMLSQAIIQNTDVVEKCVLCGTANGSSGIMKLGGTTAKFLGMFKGENAGGGLIEKMCIKNYGKKFENGNWLSRDEEVFKKYVEDEMCGGSFPFSFYKSMLTNMKKVNHGINKIGKKKVFLIAGEKDPVGSNGKQVTNLNKLYLKNNIDSRCKIYPECRHELLNELNKDEVYKDVLDFYNN